MHTQNSTKTEALSVIILAAGMGTRMRSSLPKVLHHVGGLPLIGHVARSIAACAPTSSAVVIGEGMEAAAQAAQQFLPDCQAITQKERLGTAHAVLQALPSLPQQGTVLIAYGDTPFITPAILQAMHQAIADGAGGVVLGFRPQDPAKYGRLVLENTQLSRIVEYKDANESERAITLCNSGVMGFDAAALHPLLPQINNKNAAGEYYLTDMVALLHEAGRNIAVIETDEEEVLGINSQHERSQAESLFQTSMRHEALDAGVQMTAPDTVFFTYDTQLEPGCIIEPYVVFGPRVKVAAGATICAFSHLEGAHIAENASIGPYARLRPGSKIEKGAKIGNFVEVKNSTLKAGAKAGHLSYLGDATIGEEANIGAGTITCNYDGQNKHHTNIGAHAFIGSNSSLIAPIVVGEKALIAAGSTVRSHVAASMLYYNDMQECTKEKP